MEEQSKKPRIILFAGPSGSGKTTLAKAIAEATNIPFVSTSAGDILTANDVGLLTKLSNGAWRQSGHESVIKLSAVYPHFGRAFQGLVARRRFEIIRNYHGLGKSLIMDRSPLDILVYATLQVGYHQDGIGSTLEMYWADLYSEVSTAMGLVTDLIYVSYEGVEEVEVNGSRVSHLHYQKAVDAVFEYFYNAFCTAPFMSPTKPSYLMQTPRLMGRIGHWDQSRRVKETLQALNL